MSKARLVITAVLIEGRSQSQVARDYGVSQSWISSLIARYTLEGDAAYKRRSLAIGSHWPFEQWGRFLPEQTTAVSILDRLLHHATVVITDGDSYRMKDAQHRKGNPQPT